MPAERGKDAAEKFAAAVDSGRSPLSAGSDADLARELAIAARLRSLEGTLASHEEAMAALRSGTDACAPRPDEKALAKQRLMALLAERGLKAQPVSDVAPLGHYVLADVYNRQGRPQDAAAEVAKARRMEGAFKRSSP